MRVCASRGLAREALGLWILSCVMLRKEGVSGGCHSPLPGVSAVFCFFEMLWGLSSGGRFLVCGAPLYAGGLRVCDVLSGGFGASVLALFGERGLVAVGQGGGPKWSGTGCLGGERLGAWRSVRAGLGGLLGAGPSV